MLEYGSDSIHEGIRLDEIKTKLESEGLIEKGDFQEYLLKWFEESFQHKERACECNFRPDLKCACSGDTDCPDFEHIKYCRHFLKPELCVQLLHLKESEFNSTVTNRAKRLGEYAIGIALLGLLFPIFIDQCYSTSELKQLKTITDSLAVQNRLYDKNIKYNCDHFDSMQDFNALDKKIDSIMFHEIDSSFKIIKKQIDRIERKQNQMINSKK